MSVFRFRAQCRTRRGRLIPLAVWLLCAATAHARQTQCNQVHETPSCDDAICSALVCEYKPACCADTWDSACVAYANSVCSGCGVNQRSCREIHWDVSGCGNTECCNLVCAIDPFCCQVEWDFSCVVYAGACPAPPPLECGAAGTESCNAPHDSPSCSNADCCEQVCSYGELSYCCSEGWDDFCVQAANWYCPDQCATICPLQADLETEFCSENTNDPGFRSESVGTPQALTTVDMVCGTVQVTGTASETDVDVYALNLTNEDTDGDGLVKVRMTFLSGSPMFVSLVPPAVNVAGLASAHLTVNSDHCGESTQWSCVAPGLYWVVVAPGTDGTIDDATEIDCGGHLRNYHLTVEHAAVCGTPCGASSESCFQVHEGISCSDPACCAIVCGTRPLCCDLGWDTGCAEIAIDVCTLPLAANDVCGDATPMTDDITAFELLTATADSLACSCAVSVTPIGQDVWFAWQPTDNGVYQVSTCGTDFDTRLQVFSGACHALSPIACSDNSSACSPPQASVTKPTVRGGYVYLIRVSAVGDQRGIGQLSITPVLTTPACRADVDGSGEVDFGDIAFALLDFGPCEGCAGDLDNSGSIDFGDTAVMLLEFGQCPQ